MNKVVKLCQICGIKPSMWAMKAGMVCTCNDCKGKVFG